MSCFSSLHTVFVRSMCILLYIARDVIVIVLYSKSLLVCDKRHVWEFSPGIILGIRIPVRVWGPEIFEFRLSDFTLRRCSHWYCAELLSTLRATHTGQPLCCISRSLLLLTAIAHKESAQQRCESQRDRRDELRPHQVTSPQTCLGLVNQDLSVRLWDVVSCY